jgi:tRNA(Leu) C34 or U34 (ribose-2'-O)-methylase TrmL
MENLQAKARIAALNDTIDNLYRFYGDLIDLDKQQRFSMDCYNELSTRIQDKINQCKKSIQEAERVFYVQTKKAGE